jgi:hypothetical protein
MTRFQREALVQAEYEDQVRAALTAVFGKESKPEKSVQIPIPVTQRNG